VLPQAIPQRIYISTMDSFVAPAKDRENPLRLPVETGDVVYRACAGRSVGNLAARGKALTRNREWLLRFQRLAVEGFGSVRPAVVVGG
jgi:hypothetical protein